MADMARELRELGDAISRKGRIKANRKAANLFKEKLRENYNESMGRKNNKTHSDDSVISTLTTDTTTGGAVGVGFSKKGKKAYLARFQNDGWIPRNGKGGPYMYHPDRNGHTSRGDDGPTLPMVPGLHFWEKTATNEDLEKQMIDIQIKELNRLLGNAARK